MINIKAWGLLDSLAEKADFLDGFFKLVKDLVDEKKYPIFFNDFYIDGNVDKSKTSILLQEVCEIESILKSINKDESLISKQPDILKVENYPKFLDNSATNMADYFLTPNKESMFEVFKFNIEYAIKKDAPVFIKYYLM